VRHVPVQRQYSRKLAVVPERHEAPSPRATDQTATRRQKHGSLTPPADIFSRNGNTRGSFFQTSRSPRMLPCKGNKGTPTALRRKTRCRRKRCRLVRNSSSSNLHHGAEQRRLRTWPANSDMDPHCQQAAFPIKLQLQLRSAHTVKPLRRNTNPSARARVLPCCLTIFYMLFSCTVQCLEHKTMRRRVTLFLL
jgi:hypothetical protein